MALFNVRVMNVVRESDGARVSTRVEVSEITDILVMGGRIRTVQDIRTGGHWRGVSPTAFNGGGRVVMAGLGESSGAGRPNRETASPASETLRSHSHLALF